jgi:UDP-N-acetylmuramoyl-tripeptide--D-alanyl-D-alanine ligase
MGRGNLNNELGLPLVILGDYKTSGGASFWLKVIMLGFFGLIWRKNYPGILILEYGADKPGDMDYLLTVVKPEIAVVTAVGEIPVHVEFYNGPEGVAKEKGKLAKSVGSGGSVVLNIDDPFVADMKDLIKGNVMTYGFMDGADLKISSFMNRSEDGKPLGVSFKLETGDNFVPVKIDGSLGKAVAYSAAAAAAVGLFKGMNLVEISEVLAQYHGEPGRCYILDGVKNTNLIDDTYNSSPIAVASALEILKDMPAHRKVAILGDMSELGQYTNYAHEEAGKLVSRIADILVTVGDKGKFIADGAEKHGLSKKNIYSFADSEEAVKNIKDIIEPHDLILIKGSQSVRMERIVMEIMAEPKEAAKLLVRQYGKWLTSI